MSETGIVILAAGSSSRLGKPKQLLPLSNKVLVAHIADEALQAGLKTAVVTGSYGSEVAQALAGKEVMIVQNECWEKGMGASISVGVAAILAEHGDLRNIITAVCDQPFVSAELFQTLKRKKRKGGKGIVACSYDDTLGTPVLFDAVYFNELQGLKGKEGAKKLLKEYADDVFPYSFEGGSFDIDTEEDYHLFMKSFRW